MTIRKNAKPAPNSTDTSLTAQNDGLRTMRRIATGVLGGLTCTFAATYIPTDPPSAVLLIRAMAEAGMIGGLADWFAVEALFRHPLGLPIPHTALLPSNQQRAAQNVGEFFDTHFMDPKQLRARIAEVDPVLRLAEWLLDQGNALFISQQITGILASLFKSGIKADFLPKSSDFLKKSFLSSMQTEEMADAIATLLKQSLHGEILDELLQRVQAAIEENRDQVDKMVEERSRWWIASSVDHRIAGMLVDGVISVVRELGNSDSELRGEFENSISHMIDEFQQDGMLAKHIDNGKAKFVDSDIFAERAQVLVQSVQDRIASKLNNNPEQFAQQMVAPVQGFARQIQENDALRADLETRLFDGLEQILIRMRPAISAYVTQTISDWDSDVLIDRFESAVGRDLQFIRINGAILGALIGGVLFFIDFLAS